MSEPRELATTYWKTMEEVVSAVAKNSDLLKRDARLRGKFNEKQKYLEDTRTELTAEEVHWIEGRYQELLKRLKR